MPAVNACALSPPTPRDRLVHAAAELFATRGFQAIGLRDLAGHLGLQAGSLYHHIENKQGLLFELIESALSDLLAMTRRSLKGARTPAERVRRFVQAFVSFALHEKYRLILVTREFVSLNEEQQHHADQLKRAHSALLRDIIAEQYPVKGKQDTESNLITHAVMGMLYGQWQWNEVQITQQHLTEMLTGCVIRIIASQNLQVSRTAFQTRRAEIT